MRTPHPRTIFAGTLLAAALLWAAPAAAETHLDLIVPPERQVQEAPRLVQPSAAPVEAERWMVATAHPLAAEAGAEILRAGGSAADAAVAVQLVLGLVEPQSSGLGGGAFLLYWDADEASLTTLDAREAAPRAARPTLFLDEAGEPLGFMEAVVGGRSVGVPGTPRLLHAMHRRWGRLEWPDLFESAVRLAEDGFPVSPRLSASIAEHAESLARFEATRRLFLGDEPVAPQPGASFRNPDYAETLRILAREGVAPFYEGEIARDIVAAVEAAGNPGGFALSDLAAYDVVERPPLCVAYRGFDVCGMGPPSSGGLAVGQILGILAHFDLEALGPESVEAWQLFADATRLAFADRERYVADSDFVPVPVRGLLARDYLSDRAGLIIPGMRLEAAPAGHPEWDHARAPAALLPELPATSHFVVADGDGNVASMTTTIESAFGSRVTVRGFLLNNELTDFSFRTHRDGVPVVNRVEPGKRPRSSMAPTIVLHQHRPVLALGSPGGARIIPFVARTLIAAIDWGLDVQAAIDLPHLVHPFGALELEADTAAVALAPALEVLGYEVVERELSSGLQAIMIGDSYLLGGADPRREGAVVGE